MKGAVYHFLETYFKGLGLDENTLSGKIKLRSIRIQISLQGINLANFTPESIDSSDSLNKVKNIIQNLKLAG
jgi:hypothetical protein